jgi:hypothetical protein
MCAEIATLFPKAKMIILKRNPINVAKSMVNTWNIQSFEGLGVFNRDLLLGPRTINKFERDNLNNPFVYSLNYEDIVKEPGNEIRKLYQWIGIEYAPKVLKTEENQKYKGKYGDPFQNKNISSVTAKLEAKSDFANSDEFVLFLEGYSRYLEHNSSMGSADNKNSFKTKASILFNAYYENYPIDNSHIEVINLKRKLQSLETSTKYKIGSFVVQPLQYISKKFKTFFKK